MPDSSVGLDRSRYLTVSEVAEWAARHGLRLSKPTIYLHLRPVSEGGTGKLTPYYNALQDTTYVDIEEVKAKLAPQPGA